MGSDLADLSIDSQEEMVPASLRPRPLPPSSSMRNLTQQLDSRTITEQLREREQQRELARARSLANLTRASSMRSLDARSPRVERTANAEVPISKRREQSSAAPNPGRRMSTMAPSNGQRASAASRGPLGFPRSTVPRDLALGTGPSRMSAPATSFTKRTLPPSESARRLSALPSSSSSRRLSTAPSSSTLSRRLSAVPTSSVPDTPRRQSTLTRRQSMLPPRNERAQAANERSKPSRTSTISRTESMQSVRRQSTLMTRTNSWNSQGEPEPRGGRKSILPERSERRQSVLPRSGSAQSQERESGHRLRPSSSAVIGERKSAGIPRTTTSRNLATSPVKRASAPPTSTAREALGARRSLAPAPTAGPTPSTKRHSMLPSTRSTTTLRKFAETPASKVPERREREQPQNARTRSDTTSAVSAAPSTVPSLCSAPTIDSRSSKLSAPSSEADVEWLPPLPEASFECKPAVTLTQPTPAKSVLRPKTETTSRIARRESRPNLASDLGATRGIPRSQSRESQQSGSGSERDAQRQRNTLAVSGNSRVSGASGSSAERRVSWNESLRAPIRSGHVEEMRTKYGHRTASGRSVGAEVAVDEMGRAVSGRVQASTVGSLRRFR
ncbi:hypothetical protein A1Q2_01045 [Trichosporon asahii var. asahii CBS 8904]|uniref:Uncharacterized protein n=1 Tax=Trichosporon asahii var. asahii (strain CBS 8904) TaxID=1220162 RepID=K1VKJ1_TRIAC|nr:hypothetical protein A1Q2_01045 [Trichosporon asahii var. asahii CBS 8904]